eukprot:204061-Amphidinium_carterae.1
MWICGTLESSTDRWMRALMQRDSRSFGGAEEEDENSRPRVQREKTRNGQGGVCQHVLELCRCPQVKATAAGSDSKGTAAEVSTSARRYVHTNDAQGTATATATTEG